MSIEIRTLHELPLANLDTLLSNSRAEGFANIGRLIDDWQSGQNCFDRPGETLLGAYDGNALVGIAGLNQDPFCSAVPAGRIRRLYIVLSHRRRGIGQTLVERLIAAARPHFELLTVRTNTVDGSTFYEALGFVRTDEFPESTHALKLGVG